MIGGGERQDGARVSGYAVDASQIRIKVMRVIRVIKVKVKTIWHGQVAIRDKYLKQAEERMEDILIIHGQEQMLINHRVAHKYRAVSAKPVRDRFSPVRHYLIYYDWIPTVRQESLI